MFRADEAVAMICEASVFERYPKPYITNHQVAATDPTRTKSLSSGGPDSCIRSAVFSELKAFGRVR